MGLPHRRQPGQLMPSVCTSSRCLPAAPSCPVPAHAAGVLLRVSALGRQLMSITTSLLLAGWLQAAPHQPLAGCLLSPSQQLQRARSRQTAVLEARAHCMGMGCGAGLTRPGEVPTQPVFPWDAPQQKHPWGLNNGNTLAWAWHRAGLGTPRHEAAVTNPIHQWSPARGARQHSHRAAPLPGSPRWVPGCQHCHRTGVSRAACVHTVPSPASGDSSSNAAPPYGKATTASLHRCLFPCPKLGPPPRGHCYSV